MWRMLFRSSIFRFAHHAAKLPTATRKSFISFSKSSPQNQHVVKLWENYSLTDLTPILKAALIRVLFLTMGQMCCVKGKACSNEPNSYHQLCSSHQLLGAVWSLLVHCFDFTATLIQSQHRGQLVNTAKYLPQDLFETNPKLFSRHINRPPGEY